VLWKILAHKAVETLGKFVTLRKFEPRPFNNEEVITFRSGFGL
jgi:hypothetical protein